MRETRSVLAALVIVCIVASGCASLGGADPVLVRAEDVEANSLSLYKTVILGYHMKQSKTESPEVYAALEKVRVEFPKAWKTLSKGIDTYKDVKDKAGLYEKLEAVEELYFTMKRIWVKKTAAEGLP